MTVKDIRPALRSFLLADAAISTAVAGARVYSARLPQGQRLASIVYTRVSGIGDYHMQGASGLGRPRFQIDAWAPLQDDATALANLVKDRIDGFRGVMADDASPPAVTPVTVQGAFQVDEREDYDATVELHRVSRDFEIWFEER
jgi:hypothetical protein